MANELTFDNHSRDFTGYNYIYPVLSRRSQGVSLGVNLNINNACNWRCIYCQVDGLIRGKPERVDVDILEQELDRFLNEIYYGDFLIRYAPEGLRRLNDISMSGNGEPTLSAEFLLVVKIMVKLKAKYDMDNQVKLVLITNGSEVEKSQIQNGLELLTQNNGEVWFKIDRVNNDDIAKVNQVNMSLHNLEMRLKKCSQVCKTYIQSCFFKRNDNNPTDKEVNDYVEFIIKHKYLIAGVLLYSTAREPMLSEGSDISQVSIDFLKNIADKLLAHKISVKYYQ